MRALVLILALGPIACADSQTPPLPVEPFVELNWLDYSVYRALVEGAFPESSAVVLRDSAAAAYSDSALIYEPAPIASLESWRFNGSVPAVHVLSGPAFLEVLHEGGAGDGWDNFDALFPGARYFVTLSVPTYNADSSKAEVWYSASCGPLCGGENVVWLHPIDSVDGPWQLTEQFGVAVY